MSKPLLALFLFSTAVFAQRAFIGLPTSGQVVNPGSSLLVQLQQPDSLTNYEEVAVVIALQSCPNRPCFSPSDLMGTVLYNGPFNPQFHEGNMPPYQNFTVQVPSSVPQGTAQIGVAHLELVGAGFQPLYETLNQTISIA